MSINSDYVNQVPLNHLAKGVNCLVGEGTEALILEIKLIPRLKLQLRFCWNLFWVLLGRKDSPASVQHMTSIQPYFLVTLLT